MDAKEVRRLALSLPEATEQPHFEMTSFRIGRRIFATLTPDEAHLHVFLDEHQTHAVVSETPAVCEELWWGKQLSGVRISLAVAGPELVFELLESAWRRKAPRSLSKQLPAVSEHHE